MASIEQIAQGKYVNKYNYTSQFDASSPWSMILALMPETVSPKDYVRTLDNEATSVSTGEDLEQPIRDYISELNKSLGWADSTGSVSAQEAAQNFMQLRLRQIDAATGSINWDSGAKYIESPWYKGIVRPLSLLRDKYATRLSLADFEAMTPEQVLDLLNPLLSAANSAHIINYIVEPYTTYLNRPELMTKLVESVPLSAVLKLSTKASTLKPALLTNCYQATPLNIHLLDEISSRVNDPGLKADIGVARILHPERLQVVADIRHSDETAQTNAVSNFIVQYPHPLAGIWNDLDVVSTACPLVTKAKKEDMVLNEAVRRGDFDLIEKQKSKWDSDLVKSKTDDYIYRMRTKMLSGEVDASALAPILAASKLTGDTKSTEQYKAVQSLYNRYGLPPATALTSTPSALLEKVLEVHPRAYQRQDALVNEISNATQENVDINHIRGQFVEFALVDNNFNAAVQFCEAMDPTNDATWIAYLQTTRFMSSLWDSTPPKILAKKKELITTCIKICPPQDIATVLSMRDKLYDTTTKPAALQKRVASQSSPEPGRSQTPEPGAPGSKRKAVQNLLVSGIGWAIGAPADNN